MWDLILLLFIIGGYVALTYFLIIQLAKHSLGWHPYVRLLTLSFVYALLWGIGIAATGGDPGFGFPAPNVLAIAFMINIGYVQGIATGLYILGFWWIIILAFMVLRKIIKKYRSSKNHQRFDFTSERT